jgi:xanthine dehydrogenase iron-sulfur cluster and FAD-binding subunit A
VLKKSEDVICLSFKVRRRLKEEISSFENAFNLLLNENITQNVCVSFCLSGNMEKEKQNPNGIFIDSLDLGASLELKTQMLNKNLKFLTKLIKPIPRFLKFWTIPSVEFILI